uniref:Thioredoxin family protein n=1 Tax=Euplotes crassus TaxID=5936 RepID=A0A7S3KRL8_EUPCR|mmetsp:Transcript_4988/g.4769  ORF Transcript_4988/g.4769 Transcript_4988/m.4769 type:complete len:234 (+) Transcript_4988:11-712(+)
MKGLSLCVLLISIAAVFAQNQQGNWADHNTGHELFVALADEPETLFVMLWFKDMPNNQRQIKVNDDARRELYSLVNTSHPGAIYTEIDMSNSNRNAYTYERLATKQLGINLSELEFGPIVVILRDSKGEQIIYKGNYQDFMQTVDQTIHVINAENEMEVDKVSSREVAREIAKNIKFDKPSGKYDYYRPAKYDPTEFQTEKRYGFQTDPTYNENPVASRYSAYNPNINPTKSA